jgi:hypothetical protein
MISVTLYISVQYLYPRRVIRRRSSWVKNATNVEATDVEATDVEATDVEATDVEATNVEATNVEAPETNMYTVEEAVHECIRKVVLATHST